MKKVSLYQALRQCERWKDRWGIIRSQFYYIPRYRLENRILDGWAVLLGACNKSTWTGLPPTGYAGGYSHWRCGKARGHAAGHRFQNYIWSGDPADRGKYSPLPVRNADNTGFYDSRAVIPFRKVTSKRRAIERRGRSRVLAEINHAALLASQEHAALQARRSGKEFGLGWRTVMTDGDLSE